MFSLQSPALPLEHPVILACVFYFMLIILTSERRFGNLLWLTGAGFTIYEDQLLCPPSFPLIAPEIPFSPLILSQKVSICILNVLALVLH